jgi:hypothetical protein
MKTVFCTLRVEGFHLWPGAPAEVAFLAHSHRHEFHVRVEVSVSHDNRQIEFITLKRYVADYLSRNPISGEESCEMVAQRISEFVIVDRGWTPVRIEVSEDGENGSVWTP